MNEFEQEKQSTRNDFADCAVGFTFSFAFFAIIFIIATVIKVVGS